MENTITQEQTAWLTSQEYLAGEHVLIGNRIPKDYFITQGRGESDITIHAGSYHLALRQAGIEMCNIMTYSSILPKIATQIERPDPSRLTHGAVMDTIMAVRDVNRGERATVGITYGWLYDRETNEKHGGLVCEYNGDLPESEVSEQLNASLNELYTNGYEERFRLADQFMLTDSFVPKKKYGSVLISICFQNYVYPIQQRLC
ncbi:MAG: arginine decarboxylase [Phycisphaerae bacterium]|nr:arginine decarboxylase [Phycisphaerae bacterium]